MKTKNSTYLVLTIVLVILSAVGAFFLIKTNASSVQDVDSDNSASKIELIPTDSLPESEEISVTPSASPSGAVITPTITATSTPTPTKKPISTPTEKITPTPTPITPGILDFSSTTDGFSVSYNSSRKVYQDKESTGNRYTFYSISGNFAIHVATGDQWAWIYPSRKFTSDLLISGKPTFKYEIATQTIIDLQSNDKNYTIQCVHNGNTALKTECESFYRSFKLY